MIKNKARIILAYIIISISFLITGFWTYWGINEAFHEGWYHTSLLQNLFLTFIQYLSIPIIFLSVSLIAMNYKKIGSGLFLALGIFTLFFFTSNAGRFLILVPLFLFTLGFYFGEFRHKKTIIISFITIFVLIIFSFGIPQLVKVENRYNDNNFGLRVIAENGVNLSWAPSGIGYPLKGTDWNVAKDICARLNENGTELSDDELNIWKLPTREELVKSLTRKNINSGGIINKEGIAEYRIKPDKETPLWNPHSQVIYYWTSESKDEKNAYLVAYNGFILDRHKNSGADYQGYRCIKTNLKNEIHP